MYPTNNAEFYEALLAAEGMPAELSPCADVSLSTSTEAQHDLCKDYTTED